MTFLVDRLASLREHLDHLEALRPKVEGPQSLQKDLSLHNDVLFSLLTAPELVDTEQGNHGLVLVAVPIGRGLVVLDETARSRRRLPFGRLPGFDPDHPNALKQDGVWRNYDWPELLTNAKERAADSFR